MADEREDRAPGAVPEPDPVTVAYLSRRVVPANQDCQGTPATLSVVGARLPRADAYEKVTGAARYAGDLSLPRMLHARILRSPHPHARIRGIDASRALALEGVLDVVVGADMDRCYGIIPWTKDERALATDRVRYVGDEIAAVAATSERIAEAALALIDVDYELLPPVPDVAAAQDPNRPGLHGKPGEETNLSKAFDVAFGDVDAGLARAEVVVEGEYHYAASSHVPLETHAVLADYGADGRLTVWSSTQTPHYLHRDLARVLDLDARRIRVIKPAVGGGFGGKSEPLALEFCAALLSMRTRRPVRIRYRREETFLAHRGRHAMDMAIRLGYHPEEGLSLDFRASLDGGAYSSYGMVTTYYAGALSAGIYKVANYRLDSRRYFTTKPAAGPKRGHGAVQPRFAIECALDRLAERLGRDPIALRAELFAGERHRTINGLQIGSSGYLACLAQAAERAGWSSKFRKLPFGRGIGVATSFYISGTNYPIQPDLLPQSGVQLKADRSGLVTIFSGASDIGQGCEAVLRQIVAEELGVRVEACRVVAADTDLCPVDLGSYSSRVTMMAGNAAISAARHLRRQIHGVVARRWGVDPAALGYGSGEIFLIDDPTKVVSFLDALRDAEAVLGTLGSTGGYTTPNRGGDYRGALVGPSPAYSFTVHIAEVEVDPETGRVRVERVVAAHDCGRAINPTLVEGQIEGSVYMGLGEALTEELRYQGSLLQNPNLLDYLIPTSLDTPPIEAIVVEAPDPEGPYGAKEAGEGPLHPAVPAIANAIHDAVGVRLTRCPFHPEDVLRALRTAPPSGEVRS